MTGHPPEDWPQLFEQALERADLDGLVALYDPTARFVQRSGEMIIGRDRIRDVLAQLIRSQTRLRARVLKAVTVDDLALLYTDFAGSTVDASGARVAIAQKAIELLRRYPDGTWKLIIGDPNGRG